MVRFRENNPQQNSSPRFFLFNKERLFEFFACTFILFLFLCIFFALINLYVLLFISGAIVFSLQWWRATRPLRMRKVPVDSRDLNREYLVGKSAICVSAIFLFIAAISIFILIIWWFITEKNKDVFDLTAMGFMLFLAIICAYFGSLIQKSYWQSFKDFETYKKSSIADEYGELGEN